MRRLLFIVLLLVAVPCSGGDKVITLDSAAHVCFTPGADCTGLIVTAIGSAQKKILVQAYSFTSKPIANALMQAQARGVSVVAILDKSNKRDKGYSAASFLSGVGVETYIDSAHKIAHNKVMVIDDETVITGSFNFTKAAQYNNAENVLIIKSKALAKEYKNNFQAHLKHSEQIKSRY